VKSTNHQAADCAVFFSLLLCLPSQAQRSLFVYLLGFIFYIRNSVVWGKEQLKETEIYIVHNFLREVKPYIL
jgi:hypothetical protein